MHKIHTRRIVTVLVTVLFSYSTLLLIGCSKEEKLQERINGTWITTSVKIDGVEEQNVWDPVTGLPQSVCGSYCYDEYKMVHETWTVNDNGNIFVVIDKKGHHIDLPVSESKCSCVYEPEFSYDSDYDATWELSSDGKTFTIIASGTRYPYEVHELTKTKLRLSRTIGGKNEDYTFEKH